MAYTFLALAKDVLEEFAKREKKYALTPKELWDKACEYQLNAKLKTLGKTPWQTICAQLYLDIRDNKSTPFAKVGERPTRFTLKKNLRLAEDSSNDDYSISTKVSKYQERDLHPLLTKFVSGERFKCFTKTIDEKRSSKHSKGQNEWLHPDLIGVYYPFDDFESETLDLVKSFTTLPIKFYSFEMKKELNWGHLKEYFFQAVSNSSWANEGYLVALKYETEPEFTEELRRLNNAFGIGFIRLNSENIDQSEILFPSITRNIVDWDTLNRLSRANKDVKELIINIKESVTNKRVKKVEYDKILDEDELKKLIKEKNIE